MGSRTLKLSSSLVELLSTLRPVDIVDVVIELRQTSVAIGGSRQERVSGRQLQFTDASRPVKAAVTAAQGEVVDEAWLNGTLRVRVPASAIEMLAELAVIELIDTPVPISVDA